MPVSTPVTDNDEEGGEEAVERADSVTEAVEQEADGRLKEREPEAQVKRVDPITGKITYLDTVAASIVSEEWLAENYGGGRYQIYRRGYVNGRWQYAGHETFAIDESIPFKGSLKAQRNKQRERDELRGSLHDADGKVLRDFGGGDDGGFDDIIKSGIISMMREQQQQSQLTTQMVMGMMEQSRAGAAAERQAMMEMMRAMRESSASKTDVVGLIGALTPLAQLILPLVMKKDGPDLERILTLVRESQPKGSEEKLSDMLELLAKFREATGAGDGEGGGFGSVVEKFAAILPALIQARSPVAPANAVAKVAEPTAPPIRGELPSGVAIPENVTADDVWNIIGQNVTLLRGAAALNRAPHRVAAMVVEFAQPQQRALLQEVLADDTFLPQFFERFPEMQTYRVWTTSFVQALQDELFGVTDDEDADEPEEAK